MVVTIVIHLILGIINGILAILVVTSVIAMIFTTHALDSFIPYLGHAAFGSTAGA